jgi:hypothetical protein
MAGREAQGRALPWHWVNDNARAMELWDELPLELGEKDWDAAFRTTNGHRSCSGRPSRPCLLLSC